MWFVLQIFLLSSSERIFKSARVWTVWGCWGKIDISFRRTPWQDATGNLAVWYQSVTVNCILTDINVLCDFMTNRCTLMIPLCQKIGLWIIMDISWVAQRKHKKWVVRLGRTGNGTIFSVPKLDELNLSFFCYVIFCRFLCVFLYVA